MAAQLWHTFVVEFYTVSLTLWIFEAWGSYGQRLSPIIDRFLLNDGRFISPRNSFVERSAEERKGYQFIKDEALVFLAMAVLVNLISVLWSKHKLSAGVNIRFRSGWSSVSI